ncbi:MAG: AAA family ATPase [Deltaproteobacteria bacterium]|nr:AAA family ATPase [Deltaproteobacteria bacterium]
MTETGTESFVVELKRLLASGFPIVCVVTHEESRALPLVRSVIPNAKVPVWTVTAGFDGDGSAKDPADAVLVAAASGASALHVMLDLHPFLHEPRVVRALRDFAQIAGAKRKALVLIVPKADIPIDLEKDVALLDLPLPDDAQLGELIQAEVAQAPAMAGWDLGVLVRAARGLTSLEAQRAFRLARMLPDAHVAAQRVVSEKRRILRSSATIELVDAEVGLEDVGGLEVLKGWLRSRVLAFGDGARKFGLPEPRGMLICGVQGCGKSLVTKAASAVLGIPLVRLDFATVFSAQSPEHALRQAMRISEAIAPLVLWIDEIEKGLAGGGSDSSHARVFGEFLVWLQEKRAPVFVAATANEVDRLPPELARRGRFDDIFFVDLPATKERDEILSIHLRRRGRDPSRFATEKLVRPLEHFSGAELEQVVISGLFRAFTAGRELTDDDLKIAASEVVPLATMYEEKIQALRTWAQTRARRASADRRTLELFED